MADLISSTLAATPTDNGSIWMYLKGNQYAGPVTQEEIAGLVRGGTLRSDSLVWTKGMSEWKSLRETPIGATLSDILPPPPPAAPVRRNIPEESRVYPRKPNRSSAWSWWNLSLPGVAQIIYGQAEKGILLLLVNLFLVQASAGAWLLVAWPFTIVDALKVHAAQQNRGWVGKWEWFPSPIGNLHTAIIAAVSICAISIAPDAAAGPREEIGKWAAAHGMRWLFKPKSTDTATPGEIPAAPTAPVENKGQNPVNSNQPEVHFQDVQSVPDVPAGYMGRLLVHKRMVEGEPDEIQQNPKDVGILSRNALRLDGKTEPLRAVATARMIHDGEPCLLLLTDTYFCVLHHPTVENPYKFMNVGFMDGRHRPILLLLADSGL